MAAIAQSIPQVSVAGAQMKERKRKGYEYWAPTAKVSIGALAGAATILLSAFLGPHWRTWTQQDMTPEVGAAISSILTFVIQYWVPDRRR
jgi:hypothetical protein